ncbi:MAG: phosphotransferase family protein [Deltaproteobacteria bacterium]|nr:phosphotransferase family protein [Deltaproteobacteria bacterium]
MARDVEHMARRLRRYLPGGEAITAVVPLSTGHSNETYLLDGLDRILRLPPSEEGLLPPYDMARQHAVLSAVGGWAAGPPVPRVFDLCTDPSVIGDPFFVMERLPGEAFEYEVPGWLATADAAVRDRVCAQWIGAVTAVHRGPAERMPAPAMTVRDEAEHWREVAREAEGPRLLLELLDDLGARPPLPSGPPTPVHGDPKHGNCLWDHGRLTALLDWEMAHVGEPLTDLGYVASFYDQGELSLATAGFELPGWWPRERLIEEWERATGRAARELVRYEVLGMCKIAAIIALGYQLFRTGRATDKRFEVWGTVVPPYVAAAARRAERS